MVARLQLLGRFSLHSADGALVPISAARLQSFLAWTALHPGAHDRRRLVSVFWDDLAESQGRNNLRQLLHQLRRAWPAHVDCLETNESVAGWRVPVQVDVTEFEREFARARDAWRRGDRVAAAAALDAATARYDGPLLPGCADAWVEDLRTRLSRQAIEALELVVRLHEERHEWTAAIAAATRMVGLEPTDERSCLRLMRLYALAGDRPAALRAYEASVRALREELAIGPSAELQDAARRLAAPRRGRGASPDAEPSLPLVGREHEWRHLRRAWDDAQRGARVCVLISGEAGVGKSRLAAEMLAWAEAQGLAAARARAYEAEGRLALAPVAEWLRSAAVAPSLDQLDGATRSECSRLVPGLQDEPPLPDPAPLTDYWHRQRFFDALARAINAAAPSLVLVLDDLQWSDPDTLEWLHYLLRTESTSRLLVIGTARDDEAGLDHPLTRFRTAIRATSQLREIALAPLDAAETGRLAGSIAGADVGTGDALRLFHDTRGNPLFIVETMRAGGPAAVQDAAVLPRVQAVITGRLQQLSVEARQLAGLAAAVGRAFDPELLVAASGVEEDLAARAFDELWRRKIIGETAGEAGSYDFTHDRLRDVAYAMLGPAERRRCHLRLAATLESSTGADSDRLASQVAAQYDRGGQPARAVTYYERAARGAQRLFAYEESCVLLQRLLVLVGQVTDGAARARLEFQARVMLSAAIRVLEGWASPRLESMHTRVVELSEQIGTPEERAVARLSYAFFGEVRGEFARVRESLDELRDAAERADSPTLRVMAAAATAGYHVMTGGFATADALYRETASWYEPSQHHAHVALTGADFGVLHRAWTSHALWALGDRDGAVARASQAVDLAVAHAHPFSEALANAYLAMVYQLDGDLDACTRCAARALETATRSRVTYYAAWASTLLAWADAVRAPSPSHAARIEACIDEFVSTGAGSRLPYYLALAAEGHRHAGDRSTALDLIERALACSARQGDSWYDAELHRRHAEALADVGRTAEAEIAARRAVELAQAQGARPFEARAEETRARIAANAAANG